MRKINYCINYNLGKEKFDIVERKGKGHPDTIADTLAERLSVAYSRYTLEKFGVILHHNFDKVGLMGGIAEVSFGKGKIISPIRVLINGRASNVFGNQEIDVYSILVEETKNYLEQLFPMIDIEKDIRIMYEVSNGSSPGNIENLESNRRRWFQPMSKEDLSELKTLNCNDTSMGCSFYGNSQLESMVKKIEEYLQSSKYKADNIWIGNDIKIMGYCEDDDYYFTMAIPQLSMYVNSLEEYIINKEKLYNDIQKYFSDNYSYNSLSLSINTRDKINPQDADIYLTFTGSSIEMGDEGFVGRGNRMGGLITPRRNYTMEGICGKNPVYHTGKMYSIASYEIAKKISKEFNCNCNVELIGQSGFLLSYPWKITITTDKKISEDITQKICDEVLNNFNVITKKILDFKYELS